MDRIGKNIFFNLLGFAWPLLLSMVVVPVVRNNLGDDLYGIYALTLNLTGYFFILNTFQGAGTKYLAGFMALDETDQVEKLANTTLVYYTVIASAGALICFLAAPFLSEKVFTIPPHHLSDALWAFRLTSLGIFFSIFTWWGSSIIAGLLRYDWLAWIMILQTTIASLGSLAAVYLGWGVLGVVAANTLGLAVNFAGCFWSILRLLPGIRLRLHFDQGMFRKIFAFSAYTTLISIFTLVVTQLDQTLLGIWMGTAAVTIYNIPLNLARKIQYAANKTVEVIFPEASRLHSIGDMVMMRTLFLKSFKLCITMALLLSVPLFVFAPQLLRYWIAPDFAESASLVMRLLVISYSFISLTAVPFVYVNGIGQPRFNLVVVLLPSSLSLAGYIFLIPRFGVLGACLANLISVVISVLIYIPLFNWKFLKIPLKNIFHFSIFKPSVVALLSAAACLIVTPLIHNFITLAVVYGSSLVVFCLLTLVVKVWEPDEILSFQNLWWKATGKLGFKRPLK